MASKKAIKKKKDEQEKSLKQIKIDADKLAEIENHFLSIGEATRQALSSIQPDLFMSISDALNSSKLTSELLNQMSSVGALSRTLISDAVLEQILEAQARMNEALQPAIKLVESIEEMENRIVKTQDERIRVFQSLPAVHDLPVRNNGVMRATTAYIEA